MFLMTIESGDRRLLRCCLLLLLLSKEDTNRAMFFGGEDYWRYLLRVVLSDYSAPGDLYFVTTDIGVVLDVGKKLNHTEKNQHPHCFR
jgi:hypothetical protein